MQNPDVIQYEIDRADDALDAIDSFPKQLSDRLREICSMPLMDVTVKDGAQAMAEINDILTDLFHKPRMRLMDIAGWRPGYTPNPQAVKSAAELLLEGLRPRSMGMSVRTEARKHGEAL